MASGEEGQDRQGRGGRSCLGEGLPAEGIGFNAVNDTGRNLKVLVWNIAGGFRPKMQTEYFQNILAQYDVIIFVETHLGKADTLDNIDNINDFIVVRSDRSNADSASGGVLVLARRFVLY